MKLQTFIYCLLFFTITSEMYGQGTLINDSFYSTSLTETRMVNVYLPAGYNPADTTERYPVVYFLHHAGGTQNSSGYIISILNSLIQNNTIDPLIVVKPDGSVGPWLGSMYTNSEMYGPFEDYIVYDLVSYIDSTYNTIKNRNKRCIMGPSMGGYGSMKLLLKHPDIFKAVAAHSGALNPDSVTSLYISEMLIENGGSGPFSPNAGFFSLVMFTMAGAFSPNFVNPQYPQYNVDLIVDNNGNIIDSTYAKWFLNTASYLATQFSQDSTYAIYFDHGLQDEIAPFQSSSMFADELDTLGISYTFESYTGGHSNQLPSRFPISLAFLDSTMKSNPTTINAGNVSDTWTIAGSPYLINGDISIPNDSTLTIDPGVLVEFQGHYKLNVQGRLLAIGSKTDSIVFTVNDTTGFSDPNITDGGWHGIRFDSTAESNDSSKIVYCKLEFGKAVGSNYIDDSGGAISILNFSKLSISNCFIKNNLSGILPDGGGGGIAIAFNSNPILANNKITNNKSHSTYGGGGGIGIRNDCNPELINNIITNNYARLAGGGVTISYNSNPILKNNLIANNSAFGDDYSNGGGINISYCNPILINNTITNNSTISITRGGGGISCLYASPILINTILCGNTASSGDQVYLYAVSSDPDFYYCDVEGGTAAFAGSGSGGNYNGTYQNNVDADPLFVNAATGDYNLSDPSLCIGAGIDSVAGYHAPPTDIDGNPRPNPTGSMPDIGAYENSLGNPINSINEILLNHPDKYVLYQNYPNPFNPSTTIEFSLPMTEFVTLKIYNLLGQEVSILVSEKLSSGEYKYTWDASNLASGMYFYKLETKSYISTKKLILLR